MKTFAIAYKNEAPDSQEKMALVLAANEAEAITLWRGWCAKAMLCSATEVCLSAESPEERIQFV